MFMRTNINLPRSKRGSHPTDQTIRSPSVDFSFRCLVNPESWPITKRTNLYTLELLEHPKLLISAVLADAPVALCSYTTLHPDLRILAENVNSLRPWSKSTHHRFPEKFSYKSISLFTIRTIALSLTRVSRYIVKHNWSHWTYDTIYKLALLHSSFSQHWPMLFSYSVEAASATISWDII